MRRALLLFDELVFLDSVGDGENPLRDGDLYYSLLGRHGSRLEDQWDSLRDDYDLLLHKGVVRTVDVRNKVLINDQVLSPAFYADLSDKSFLDICRGNSVLGWLVPVERLSSRILQDVETLGTHLEPELRGLLRNYKLQWSDEQGDSFWTLSLDGIAARRMPFPVASALYLNQALIACDALGLVPVTDSVVHHRLLLHKYERLDRSESPQNSATPLSSPQSMAHDVLKHVMFSLNLLNLFLSQEELSKRSIEDLLEYRDKSRESLTHLRTYVLKVVSSIEVEPWTPEFQVHLNKLINTEVIPEAEVARDRMHDIYREMFGGVAKELLPKAMAAVTPTLVASLLKLSLGQIVALGASTFLTSMAVAVPQAIETWNKRQEQRRNGLTFLLNLSEVDPLANRLRVNQALLGADKSLGIIDHSFEEANGKFFAAHPTALSSVTCDSADFLLHAAFESEDSATRDDAASFFQELSSKNTSWQQCIKKLPVQELARLVLRGLTLPEESVNVAAIKLAGSLKLTVAARPIIDLLSTRNDYAYYGYGTKALLKIGGPDALRYIVDGIKNRDESSLREEIIESLASGKYPLATEFLINITKDDSQAMQDRSYAAFAAALLGDKHGRNFLLDMHETLSPEERSLKKNLLGKLHAATRKLNPLTGQ